MLEKEKSTIPSKIVNSIIYTLFMVLICIQGIFGLVSLIFTKMSVEQGSTWIIICICIGIIFTIFFCTATILEEIKKEK
ncbi:hypothetical protein SDC9_101595 [bioreactor metagenome]|uniref:Uncharacterized protein n=1 Tax=bioreactor metagenome TaxID=1076179 RepID=A0A645AV89_9ZZZZ